MGVSIEQNNWDSSPGQWPFSRLRSPADPGIPAELQDHPIFFLGVIFLGGNPCVYIIYPLVI